MGGEEPWGNTFVPCLHFEVWIWPWGHLRALVGFEGGTGAVCVCAVDALWNSEGKSLVKEAAISEEVPKTEENRQYE